jgi:hypothetical protein
VEKGHQKHNTLLPQLRLVELYVHKPCHKKDLTLCQTAEFRG